MDSHELILLKRSFERLDRLYRNAESKIEDFRETLRATKLELASKDRQLEAAKRMLAKLGTEKHELEMSAGESRDLSRKLAAKLTLAPEVPELQSKLQRSKRKIAELTAQLSEAQTRLMLAEEAGRQSAGEAVVLKQALGVRQEFPGLASYDGQAALLQSLAASQEESANLAAQLADGARRNSALEQQVSNLQSDVDRLVSARLAAEEATVAARREAADANGRAASLQIDLDELQGQLRRTNAHLEEVMAARRAAEESSDAFAAKSRQLKERLHATERAGRQQTELLRAEVRALAESSEAQAAELRAAHGAREGALEAQLGSAQKQVAEMEARLSQSARDHEVEVLRQLSRCGALEASLESSRLREGALERELAALREELERQGKMNASLSASLAAVRSEAAAHAARAEESASSTDAERRLRMQVQSQLEASSTRGAVREDQLLAEAGRLRAEAASVTLANERLQAELKLAHEQLSDGSARQASQDRHIEELHATISSLTKSKSKLQSTMLEQLSLFKSKLQSVEQENLALRNALAASHDQRLSAVLTAARASPGGGGGGGGAGMAEHVRTSYRSPGGAGAGAGAGQGVSPSLRPGGAGAVMGGGAGGGAGRSYLSPAPPSGPGTVSPLTYESSSDSEGGRPGLSGLGGSSLYGDDGL